MKAKAIETLGYIGISLPEAIRVFLARIVREQAFPFPLDVLNAETAAGLKESIATSPDRLRYTSLGAMLDDLEERRRLTPGGQGACA